jgi:hypothetical protein
MMANTFIAGAQKSGTTTLCRALDGHTQVVVSAPKEPAFFSRKVNLTHPEIYERCFQSKADVMPRAVIDGSNAYMGDPLIPRRILNLLGEDLRFIFCLREPVARMVSGYWHQAKRGRERRSLEEALFFASSSLDQAMREEEDRLNRAVAGGLVDLSDSIHRYDDPLWHFRYLRNSLYAADLVRFFETFGRSKIKIILFDDMVKDLGAVLSSVFEFLGIDSDFSLKSDVHRNATVLTRLPWLYNALRRLPGRELLHFIPNYAAIRMALLYRRPPETEPELVARLRYLMTPEVIHLECLLSVDLTKRWYRTSQISDSENVGDSKKLISP